MHQGQDLRPDAVQGIVDLSGREVDHVLQIPGAAQRLNRGITIVTAHGGRQTADARVRLEPIVAVQLDMAVVQGAAVGGGDHVAQHAARLHALQLAMVT